MGGSTVVLAQNNRHRNLIEAENIKTQHEKCTSNLCTNKQTITAYEMIRPSNESSLMNHLREWEKWFGFQTPLIYSRCISIIAIHLLFLVWFVISAVDGNFPKWQSVLFGYAMGGVAGFGVTAGAHRYWCHRSYKATMPLQIILLISFSVAGQNSVFNWVRDHRVHHKFSESRADPHDANRGFLFAHVGWLMMRKHPEVLRRGKLIDMSDINNDPLLRFHDKYFNVFKLLLCFVLPSLVPALLWGESWWFSVGIQVLARYLVTLHSTWSVNSFAHLFGNKPYDRSIMPVENWAVSAASMGEGWHNYHHTFPWDYRAAEMPYAINVTTVLLDLFGKLGWAYDAKTASPELIRTTALVKGEKKST